MTFTNPDKKPWRDLTGTEKGALLLAKHEGKEIQVYGAGWRHVPCPRWDDDLAYRVKPDPVVERMEYKFDKNGWLITSPNIKPAYTITFNMIDGKPNFASVKMQDAPYE